MLFLLRLYEQIETVHTVILSHLPEFEQDKTNLKYSVCFFPFLSLCLSEAEGGQ